MKGSLGFTNIKCEYHPCHEVEEQINCMFCYCPLYFMGIKCGGKFYLKGNVKDCSACTFPHKQQNIWEMQVKLKEAYGFIEQNE